MLTFASFGLSPPKQAQLQERVSPLHGICHVASIGHVKCSQLQLRTTCTDEGTSYPIDNALIQVTNRIICLQACFQGLRTRLTQCDAEHFGLTRNVEWNPVLPEGLLSQLHAANLLGSLEVIMEGVLIDCKELTPATLKQVRMPYLVAGVCSKRASLVYGFAT